jgi:hypothetical protein
MSERADITMTPQERHAARHALVVTEIEALEADLAAARARSAAAELAYERTNAEWLEFNRFATADLRPAQTVAARYHAWLREVRLELMKPVEDERGSARAAIPGIEQRLADARDELTYLSRALTASKVTRLPTPEAPPLRRKPQPVEFETIAMPREGAA